MKTERKKNDPVGNYLVKRIRELEKETKELLTSTALLSLDLEEAKKLEEIKSLFRLENGVVCLYDKGGHFQDAVATEWTDFGKYLIELLNLKEEE